MIVRNEAGFLPDCLRSVAPVVDEIVIADTGSDDGSDAIAREFGAEVFSLPWCGDFAAARNAVLDRARGAWMLYIDADERLDPIDAAALHAELDKPEMLAATVRFYPRTGFTAYREYRLFRRAEDIRFSGVIHESIRPTLRRRIAETGGHIGESALTFRHVGYDGPQTHKLDRNEALLRRQIAAHPTRAYLHWHLGAVRRDRGTLDDAEPHWREGSRLAATAATVDPADAMCAIELIKLGLERGQDVLAEIDAAMAVFPADLMLHWLRAKALVSAGGWERAAAIFARLAEIDPDTLVAPVSYDRRLFGRHARAEQGHCLLRLGRAEEAASCYRLAGAFADA